MFRRFYVQKTWKVLYSEGSMFQNFRLCIPLRVRCRYGGWCRVGTGVGTGVGTVDGVVLVRVLVRVSDGGVGGHRHTGLNSFYGANHVFPEWHRNFVGPIIRGRVKIKLGAITEYLVHLWCHIIIIYIGHRLTLCRCAFAQSTYWFNPR